MAASKGGRTEFIVESGLRSAGQREERVVEVQKEGVIVYEMNLEGVKLMELKE